MEYPMLTRENIEVVLGVEAAIREALPEFETLRLV
jgi:hypothetical protein